jgi:hypothetical protein
MIEIHRYSGRTACAVQPEAAVRTETSGALSPDKFTEFGNGKLSS